MMHAHHFGVVTGITRYPGISDLSGPVNDAQAFLEWLLEPTGGGVPSTNVELITTPDTGVAFSEAYDARPIKREIDRALELVNTQAKATFADDPEQWQESRLYLYVAGHGIMPGRGETALLLADARAGMYENLELRSYLEWYRICGLFREVVVFADCCRNWFGQVEPSAVPFSRYGRPAAQVFALVGYAAGPGDPAYEQVEADVSPDDRRGYFTQALLDGLRAAPADPALGAITSTTLAPYVQTVVEEATRHKPVPQQVEMPSDPGHPIILATPRPGHNHTVTIRFPASWSGPVELLLPGGQRVAFDPVAAPWTIELPSGAYGVVLPGTCDGSPFANEGLFMVAGGSRDVQL
ncbi:hypothetical protein GCM10010441_29760 [Kitasatospora paracochleata]|uniref:Caspase domain-containing protein n=1 Tax=Kitasatospora paracochleata TaxID=58354 RepID=A0ABT1J9Z8_9ACTN|nr:caspase family protein [Kitasatospora paracochleata]MCP2313934.1 hypothetical protein [Kitasatospora paracochleata]